MYVLSSRYLLGGMCRHGGSTQQRPLEHSVITSLFLIARLSKVDMRACATHTSVWLLPQATRTAEIASGEL